MNGPRPGDGGAERAATLVFRDADRVLLRKCAEKMSEELGAEPSERFDGMDQIFWDFLLAGRAVTLHWKRGEGIFVVPQQASPQGDELAQRVAEHLKRCIQPQSP
jgi:hypothetical protein